MSFINRLEGILTPRTVKQDSTRTKVNKHVDPDGANSYVVYGLEKDFHISRLEECGEQTNMKTTLRIGSRPFFQKIPDLQKRKLLPGMQRCILLLCLGVFLQCKDDISTESPSDVVFPVRNVSFAQHVQPLFNQTCALSGCHDAGTHPSDLCLTDYFNTVFRTRGVVTPGQPELSTIVQRIEGTLGDRMPFGLPPLNQNQINGIRTWIVEGALDTTYSGI